MKANLPQSPINDYIAAVLESYLMEDFADVTRKTTSNRPSPGQQPAKQQFDLQQLKGIKDLGQAQAYADATLPRIGEGQGRMVYRLGNNQVLKVAKNPGGQGQNQAEATVCSSDGSIDLFPKVAEVGPNNMWIVTQEAQPMSQQAFQQMTGMPFNEFTAALAGAFPNKLDQTKTTQLKLQQNKAYYDKYYGNPFFRKIVGIIQDCKYEPGDIAKLDSWGVVNGKPVIIDSGFTEAVNQAYYQGK
jgi:hypothetical protein